jgi:hypothetical protein
MRLVAIELEQQWEEKLQNLTDLEQQWQTIQEQALTELSPTQVEQIRHLTADLPALWASPETTLQERKQLLRTLIAAVTLDSTQEPGVTHIDLHWHTDAVSHLTATRPTPGHPTNKPLLERVRTLAQTQTDAQIAQQLNAEGLVSSWHIKDMPEYVIGQPVSYWTAARVRNLRNKHQIPTGMPAYSKDGTPRADGLIPAKEAARQLNVALSTLLDWFRQGFIPGSQAKPGSPIWIKLDQTNRHRFDGSRQSPTPDMVPFTLAPEHFGMTPHQLSDALRKQSLLAWRIGPSLRWFISINPAVSTFAVDL